MIYFFHFMELSNDSQSYSVDQFLMTFAINSTGVVSTSNLNGIIDKCGAK